MTERKMINKEVITLDLDGYLLKDVICNLQKLLAHYGDTSTISREMYKYDEGDYLALLVPTPETDEEMASRLTMDAARLVLQEQQERYTFERLQAKFGGVKK